MSSSSLLIVIWLTLACTQSYAEELKLLQVIFRHGDRTPVYAMRNIYPLDPYVNETWYPNGWDSLTKSGKIRAHQLGLFLRERYGSFLGDVYLKDKFVFHSSNTHRAILTTQLVAAGLFPPTEVERWHPTLDWQPIPVYSDPVTSSFLYMYSKQCPLFITLRRELEETDEKLVRRAQGLKETLDFVSRHVGVQVTQEEVALIYQNLYAEFQENKVLPQWTNGIFPDGKMKDIASYEYVIQNYNKSLIRLGTGRMIGEWMKNIDNFLNGTESGNPKAIFYGAHELNIGGILVVLGVFESHIPFYTSAIILELSKVNNEYFVKFLYRNNGVLRELLIPGCSSANCSLQTFRELVADFISIDDPVAQCKGTKVLSFDHDCSTEERNFGFEDSMSFEKSRNGDFVATVKLESVFQMIYHWNVYLLTLAIVPVVFCLDLKLVQTLCRHGDRAPLENNAKWYPTDPYIDEKYEPVGHGGLTVEGRNRSFALGQFFRRKYFQQLNLSEYSESLFMARSSSLERCLLSAQAALLALFPGSKSIPIHHQIFSEDLLFLGVFICPAAGADKALADRTLQKLDGFGNWTYLREYISQYLGLNATRYHALFLFDTLRAQSLMGLQLPIWTRKMYQSGELETAAAYEYLLQSYTLRLKRINGGMWIREFIKNMDDVASERNSSKMLLYMGHEVNIAGLLSALDKFYLHVPKFSSCVIAELHKDPRNDQHYVRLFYKKSEELEELPISGCSIPCSLVHFKTLTRHLTLRDPSLECGWNTP
ncbi:uncharacterized protein [Neodiprion pinetum]|uniref:acid phosphatase n=1 Tax=Neodiprion lecontei TaxID=441921 RepID=A0A6J0CEA6_NEOLC|nr:uncharacterized protein LOC107227718 [Neodiprion lecontei]XP_046480082.1 uncharacterized protein LOC124217931 [Neodiprion pinetum]